MDIIRSLLNEVYTNPVYFISFVALLWFVIGLLLGRALQSPRKRSRRRPQRGGKQNQSRRGGGGGGGGDSRGGGKGAVELYVGNLPYESGEKEVRKMFEKFGKVQSVRIITNKSSGSSKGYGFIEMAGREGAAAAMKTLDSQKVDGRRIVVSEAKSRER